MIPAAAGIHQEGDHGTNLVKTINTGESLCSLLKYHPADLQHGLMLVRWHCKSHNSQPTQLITMGSTWLLKEEGKAN